MSNQKENLGYVDVVMGASWGDEGKGKIVHFLSKDYDLGVRPHGGPNAGHSLEINSDVVVLNSIPCTIFSIPSLCGAGMVINPILFIQEIEKVTKYGADVHKNLYISNEIHLILPTHILIDKAEEAYKGKNKIGSTHQGIGPTYKDKAGRDGLRMGDIFSPDFEQRFKNLMNRHIDYVNSMLKFEFNMEEDVVKPAQEFLNATTELKKLKNFVHCSTFVNSYLKKGGRILSEGAQAAMLDLDFGTYPFVTSSRCLASAVPGELAIPAQSIRKVYGVLKAYTTRVGSGPFPTKITGELEDELRALGHEYGARTKRPRDVGWLDFPQLNLAVMENGITDLVVTKLDIFDELKGDSVKICTQYMLGGEKKDILDFDLVQKGSEVEPMYVDFELWKNVKTNSIRSFDALPKEAKEYIDYIETILGVPVSIVSVGPGKDDLIVK